MTQKPEETKKPEENKRPAKAQKPTIGRIVHFKTEEGDVLAAVIVGVNEDKTVNLNVFTNNDVSQPVIRIKNIEQGEGEKKWSWPPRDGE